jgi:hypothetical protein
MPIPYPRQESLSSSSSSASSESSYDEDEERALIQEEWEESLRQMEVVMSISGLIGVSRLNRHFNYNGVLIPSFLEISEGWWLDQGFLWTGIGVWMA